MKEQKKQSKGNKLSDKKHWFLIFATVFLCTSIFCLTFFTNNKISAFIKNVSVYWEPSEDNTYKLKFVSREDKTQVNVNAKIVFEVPIKGAVASISGNVVVFSATESSLIVSPVSGVVSAIYFSSGNRCVLITADFGDVLLSGKFFSGVFKNQKIVCGAPLGMLESGNLNVQITKGDKVLEANELQELL